METQEITVKPIAIVRNSRNEKSDFGWGKVESVIELAPEFGPEALDGIEAFSHLEILYHLHKSEKVFLGSEHPRGNKDFPKVGIFAQRKKDRPNHIGATLVRLLKREGHILYVSGLDAINETPVLDIKPVFEEYLPKGKIVQPGWTRDLMTGYW